EKNLFKGLFFKAKRRFLLVQSHCNLKLRRVFFKWRKISLFMEIKNEQGFTLIEIMIAASVVAIVVLGFLNSALGIQTSTQAAFERSTAVQDAHQVIEAMRNTAASGTFPSNVTTAYSNGGTVSGFSNLTSESVTVSYADAAANPLDATVTVSYNENAR